MVSAGAEWKTCCASHVAWVEENANEVVSLYVGLGSAHGVFAALTG